MYKGYIRPVMEYAALLWHSSLVMRQVKQLETTQNRIGRIILSNMYINYDHALDVLGIESLLDRRTSLCTMFALKAYHSGNLVTGVH